MLRRVGLYAQSAGYFVDIAALVVPQHEGGSFHFAKPAQRRLQQVRDLAALREPLRPGFARRHRVQPIPSAIVIPVAVRPLLVLTRPDQVKRAIGANAVEPRTERRTPVKAVDLSIGPQEGFLYQIFRVMFIARHTIGQPEYGSAVPLDKYTKGMLIAFARLLGSGLVGPFHLVGILDSIRVLRLGGCQEKPGSLLTLLLLHNRKGDALARVEEAGVPPGHACACASNWFSAQVSGGMPAHPVLCPHRAADRCRRCAGRSECSRGSHGTEQFR